MSGSILVGCSIINVVLFRIFKVNFKLTTNINQWYIDHFVERPLPSFGKLQNSSFKEALVFQVKNWGDSSHLNQ